MYLHKLEKDEKSAFLSLAKHLAKVDDNQIDVNEKYMLQYMSAEMGLDPDSAEVMAYNPDAIATVFFREEARRVLLVEAVGVCYSNDRMDSEQRKVLEELAARFSISADFLDRAEAVVKKQIEVMSDFDALIEKG